MNTFLYSSDVVPDGGGGEICMNINVKMFPPFGHDFHAEEITYLVKTIVPLQN